MPLLTAKWNYHERIAKTKASKSIGVITEWVDSAHLSIKAQARLERALDQLRQLPKQGWSKPAPASNIGDHTYVIRFKDVTGEQLRVFGHFYDAHESFVMTFQGYEKDDVYYPKNYQAMAQSHKRSCDKAFLNVTIPYANKCEICVDKKAS